MEYPQKETDHKKLGVQGEPRKTEYTNGINYYIVSVVWRDGKESEIHFPTNGFPVVNPKTGQQLGEISGERAVKILKGNSANFTQGEFSWRNFL